MRKFYKIVLVLILSLGILSGCKPEVSNTDNNDFDQYTTELISKLYSEDNANIPFLFAEPEKFNVKAGNPDLHKVNYEDSNKHIQETQALLDQLKSFDYNSLSETQKETYDVLEYEFEGSIKQMDYYYFDSELGSQLGMNSSLPYLLIAYPLINEDSVKRMIHMIDKLPESFQTYLDFELERVEKGKLRTLNTYQEIVKQAQKIVDEDDKYFLFKELTERINQLDFLDANAKDKYSNQITKSMKNGYLVAYKKIVDQIPSLFDKAVELDKSGLSYFDKGIEYYDFLLKYKIGVDVSSDDLYTYLLKKKQSIVSKMRALYVKYPDLEKVNSVNLYPDADIHTMIEDLSTKITDDFPKVIQPTYLLKEVDPSLQDNFSPAAYFTPIIDKPYTNLVLVNPSSKDDELFKTVAHETYPGHLYQFNYVFQSELPTIRKILSTTGYSEGWAKYVDHYSLKYTKVEKMYEAEFVQLNNDLIYTLWCIIDVGVNTKGWDTKKVTSVFSEFFGGFDEKASEYYFNIIQENPTNMVQYYYTCFLLQDYQKEFKDQLGSSYSDMLYHTSVLEVGAVPFPILKRHLQAVIEKK